MHRTLLPRPNRRNFGCFGNIQTNQRRSQREKSRDWRKQMNSKGQSAVPKTKRSNDTLWSAQACGYASCVHCAGRYINHLCSEKAPKPKLTVERSRQKKFLQAMVWPTDAKQSKSQSDVPIATRTRNFPERRRTLCLLTPRQCVSYPLWLCCWPFVKQIH